MSTILAAGTLSLALVGGGIATGASTTGSSQLDMVGQPLSAVSTSSTVVAAPLSVVVPRQVSTPKLVHLKIAGKARRSLTTTATTVQQLLFEQQIAVTSKDRLQPAATSPVTASLTVTLDRVKVTHKAVTKKVGYQTVTRKDAKLWKGWTKTIRQGKAGKVKSVYAITTVNGKRAGKQLASRTVVKAPVDRIRIVGTKAGRKAINLSRAKMWDRIARCESGKRWHINTGNGYYGGLQFSRASWRANGGRDFASLPSKASRAEQITVANRYYAKAGLRPWGCRHAA